VRDLSTLALFALFALMTVSCEARPNDRRGGSSDDDDAIGDDDDATGDDDDATGDDDDATGDDDDATGDDDDATGDDDDATGDDDDATGDDDDDAPGLDGLWFGACVGEASTGAVTLPCEGEIEVVVVGGLSTGQISCADNFIGFLCEGDWVSIPAPGSGSLVLDGCKMPGTLSLSDGGDTLLAVYSAALDGSTIGISCFALQGEP
jgi:hypothetical protein